MRSSRRWAGRSSWRSPTKRTAPPGPSPPATPPEPKTPKFGASVALSATSAPNFGWVRGCSAAGLERGEELREHLVDVAHDAEVGDAEDRGFLVLVDRDDVLRALHAHHVLRRTGDAGGDVDGRLDDLAGLADLVAVRNPTGVDDRARCTRGALQGLGELFDQLELGGLAESTATGNDHGRFVELRTRMLLDVHGGDGRATGRTEVARRGRHDLARGAGATFGDEALRAECREERLLAG